MGKIVAIVFISILICSMLAEAQDILSDPAGRKMITTLDIRGMDINEVLKIISDTSGWSIIGSRKVGGKTTLWLKDISVGEALEKILAANGYVYLAEGNTILVFSPEEYEQIYGKEVKVFSFQHAVATEVEKVVRSLSSNKGKVIVDSRTNKLVVVDTEENINRMGELIAALDQEMVRHIFKLTYADPETVKLELERIFPGGVQIEADKRSRQLVVAASEENIHRVKEMIGKLDQKIIARSYKLRYANPTEVKDKLSKIFSGGEGQSVLLAGFHIEADPRTNQLIVATTAEEMEAIDEVINSLDQEVKSYTFKLNYAIGEELKSAIAKIIEKDEESVHIDKRTNTVVVRTSETKKAELEDLMVTWDEQDRQVLIEAKVMLVSVNKLTKLGVNLSFIEPKLYDLKIQSSFPAALTEEGPFSALEIGNLDIDQYRAVIDALAVDSSTELLSTPRILTINNQEARFSVGSDQPYKIVTIEPSSGLRVEDVKFARVGVTLSVIPTINTKGVITMKIHPEVSSLSEIREGIPVIEKREAESTVMVKDGQTVVIGGLIKEEKIEVVNKVPILGDIPLLGLLFRNSRNDRTKKELVIFITPHIVRSENNEEAGDEENNNSWEELPDAAGD